MAARGANVCRVHGGSAPQVKRAAQRRLQQAADALTARLLGFALDQGVPDAIALQAVRDALDRAGLSPKTAVEIEVGPKPYMTILERLEGGSRAEWRRSQHITDDSDQHQPALAQAPIALPAPLDAEIVDDDEALSEPWPDQQYDDHPMDTRWQRMARRRRQGGRNRPSR